jgi:hypothetical protein
MKLPSLLRRPRAFCISTRNIIGLLFSMAGVVLLFCFALPNGAPRGPEAQWRNAVAGSAPHWEAVERRYNEYSRIGLALVLLGTAMKAVPPLCTAIGSWRRRPSQITLPASPPTSTLCIEVPATSPDKGLGAAEPGIMSPRLGVLLLVLVWLLWKRRR